MKALSLLRKKKSKGFTLVELVIVIAVLAIIAAIAIPTVKGVVDNANKATDASNIQAYALTLKTFAAEKEANSTHPLTGAKADLDATSTVDELFAAYGITMVKPKVNGDHIYVWNIADQAITIAASANASDTDEVALMTGWDANGKPTGAKALNKLDIGFGK